MLRWPIRVTRIICENSCEIFSLMCDILYTNCIFFKLFSEFPCPLRTFSSLLRNISISPAKYYYLTGEIFLFHHLNISISTAKYFYITSEIVNNSPQIAHRIEPYVKHPREGEHPPPMEGISYRVWIKLEKQTPLAKI